MTTEVLHLLQRAGFGTNPKEVKANKWHQTKEVIKDLFQTKTVSFNLNLPTTLSKDTPTRQKELKAQKPKLNLAWLKEMATTNAILQEKLTLFWHNHFGVNAYVPCFAEQHIQVIRRHAFGKFGDLLHAISKDAAMLLFLNNQQNKKTAPNENFARELLELYTLGEGNYAEQDIKEIAKAFTGWRTNKEGVYEFVQKHHDYNNKTIFGITKNFNGNDVIDLLLSKPQTATFICNKIIDFFVGDNITEDIRKDLALKYYQWDYHTGKLLQHIFEASWFYDKSIVGSRIKTPIELLVGVLRAFPPATYNHQLLLRTQRVLGQVLFQPPTVAGWPSGKDWIDSSSLLYRQNFGYAYFLGKNLNIKAKDSFDANQQDLNLNNENETLSPNTAYWDKKETLDLLPYLFSVWPQTDILNKLNWYTNNVSLEHNTKWAALLPLPEYQLC